MLLHSLLNQRFFPRCVHTTFIIMWLMGGLSAHAQTVCPRLDDYTVTPYIGSWSGYIGKAEVKVVMKPHNQDPLRLQGYYYNIDTPEEKILIVAEQVKGIFEVEESYNGTDISGIWNLAFPQTATTPSACFRMLQGEWLDRDFGNAQTITLENEVSW